MALTDNVTLEMQWEFFDDDELREMKDALALRKNQLFEMKNRGPVATARMKRTAELLRSIHAERSRRKGPCKRCHEWDCICSA